MNKGKVMIVDDEEGILFVLRKILEKNGYEVICARDGDECLSGIVREKPDLLVLDVMMPNMYGGSVLNALRGNKLVAEGIDNLSNIPVIMLTARVDEDVEEWFLKKRIQGYMQKPFDFREFLLNVKHCLNMTREAQNV
jgi:DNA-binding response OmpR family regulator